MASVTQENSYQSTNNDMGVKHEKAHSRQHKYQQKDEPNIETLTDNKPSDLSTDLAVKMAKNQGLKDEETWEEYNKHQPTERKKDSYEAYVAGAAGNFVKGKRRSLDKGIRHRMKDKKTGKMVNRYVPLGKQKRQQIAQELAAIDRNHGIPIDGSLFYISNTMMYDQMTPDELAKFRKFERKTFEDFYHSKTFQEMNPGNIRSEIHFDENGSVHLQIQDVWYRTDKRNRGMYGKTASITDMLVKKYGSEDALNRRLDALCYCHDRYEKAPGAEDRIGSPTVASKYWDTVKNTNGDMEISEEARTDKRTGKVWDYKHSQPERRGRIEELWRLEQIKALADIATENAKEMGVDWHWDQTYTTDGFHKTGAGYIQHKEAMKGVNLEKAAAEKQVKELNKTNQDTTDTLKTTYEATVGREAKDKDGKDLSPLEMSNGIKGAVRAAKRDADISKNDELESMKQADKHRRDADAALAIVNIAQDEHNRLLQLIRQRRQKRQEELQDEIKQAGLEGNKNLPAISDKTVSEVEELMDALHQASREQWQKEKANWQDESARHDKLQQQNDDLDLKNRTLQQQNHNLTTYQNNVKAENTKLTKKNKALKVDYLNLNDQNNHLKDQINNQTDQLKSLTDKIAQQTETISKQQEQINKLTKQISDTQGNLTDLQESTETARKSYGEIIKKAAKEIMQHILGELLSIRKRPERFNHLLHFYEVSTKKGYTTDNGKTTTIGQIVDKQIKQQKNDDKLPGD